jgi:hypothetical protein
MSLKTIIKLVQKLLSKNGSRHQSNPGATPLTILEMLPPELIMYVAQFLPLSSAVLFTLSCRAACAILGTSYWTSLRAEDQHQQHIDFCQIERIGDRSNGTNWVVFEGIELN